MIIIVSDEDDDDVSDIFGTHFGEVVVEKYVVRSNAEVIEIPSTAKNVIVSV